MNMHAEYIFKNGSTEMINSEAYLSKLLELRDKNNFQSFRQMRSNNT